MDLRNVFLFPDATDGARDRHALRPQLSTRLSRVSGLLAVRARRRSAHEHLAPIGVFHKYADASGVAALRLVAEELYFCSNRQAAFCKAVSKQVDRRAAFDSPLRDGA